MVEVLACKCSDCKHWEIVKDTDGRIHLYCKTCETLVPLSLDKQEVIMVLELPEGVHWIDVEKE